MIRGITPGDNYEVPRTKKADNKTSPEESGPVDSSQLSIFSGRPITREDMRKASIEYYPLHSRKNRAEAPPPESAGIEVAGPKEKKAPTAPKIITMLDNASSIGSGLTLDRDGFDVHPFEVKLQKELGPLAQCQNDWDIQGLNGEIPTLSQLQEAFAKIKTDKSVPWEYLVDGCYARAHVTCEKLLDQGINCAKEYVIIGGADPNNPFVPFPDYRLRAENKFTQGEWWYHVAPLVFAKDEKTGQVEGYIVDLAVNNQHPIKAADWIKSCWDGKFPIQFDTTYADIYDPPEQSSQGEPAEFDRERFDKFLPEARDTNKDYSRVLAKIKKDYYAHHPDEKPDDGKRA